MKYGLFFILIGFHCAYASNYLVRVGDTKVIVKHQKYGRRGPTFVHLHQNETTALLAAKKVARLRRGRVLTLVHSGTRNVVFHLNHKRYEFDPNRIFTEAGIKSTLAQYSTNTPAARTQVRKLANKIKRLLPKKRIIAVHNNKSYSLRDYYPGQKLAKYARALAVNKPQNVRNFYLVTKRNAYFRLNKLKFNGIWQAKDARDDGSLSVFLANRDYVNVEAGYDQLSAQIKMLRYI